MKRPYFVVALLVCFASIVLLGTVGLLDRGDARMQSHERGGARAGDQELHSPLSAMGESTRDSIERVSPPPTEEAIVAEDGSLFAIVTVRRIEGSLPGDTVAGARVLVRRGTRAAVVLGTTSAEGELRAPLHEPGRYSFTVAPDSVPEGLLPPGDIPTTGWELPGVSRVEQELGTGEDQRVTLWLPEARSLRGIVIGPAEKPVPGVILEARAQRGGLERVHHRQVTDELGEFHFESLLPLQYAVRLMPLEDPGQRLPDGSSIRDHPLPPPVFHDLREESAAGVEIRIRPGEVALHGRIVDEQGRPFPGLDVLAHYVEPDAVEAGEPEAAYRYTWGDRIGRVTSDANGRFRLDVGRDQPLVVQVSPDGSRNGGRGERILAACPLPIPVDPTSDPRREWDLGDVEVRRPHTYEVSGRIVLSAERIGRTKLKLSKLRADGRFETPVGRVPPGVQQRPHVVFDSRAGTFVASCDTPRDVLILRVYAGNDEELAKEFRFTPVPDLVEDGLVLQYP